jgi:hypothetical protein
MFFLYEWNFDSHIYLRTGYLIEYLDVIGRKLHNEEFHNWYALPNVIRIIKLRSKRWAEHVVHMGKKKNAYKIMVGKSEGKRQLEVLGKTGMIIFRWLLRK